MMDEDSIKKVEEMESISGKPSGIGKIDRGECERGAINAIACNLCPFGHMLECHYPLTCDEAECGHYDSEA